MLARVLLPTGLLEHTVKFLAESRLQSKSKGIGLSDDLILAIRCDSVSAVENYWNGELSK
jgi:hypothetical protein